MPLGSDKPFILKYPWLQNLRMCQTVNINCVGGDTRIANEAERHDVINVFIFI